MITHDYIMYKSKQYSDDYKRTKDYLSSYYSNYFLATKLFRSKVREATTILYAFLRHLDEVVDNPDNPSDVVQEVHNFKTQWEASKEQPFDDTTHYLMRGVHHLVLSRSISYDYLDDFIEAMERDLYTKRYERYEDLQEYMWGSAVVVGYLMSYFVGFSDTKALDHAQALAEAMQLTNFLRDVDDDYQVRDRIYLPQEDMRRYGVTENMIAQGVCTDELRALMRFYVERSYRLYEKGIQGLYYLQSERFSIYLSAMIYREHLRVLKKNYYDPFSHVIKISTFRKMMLLGYALITFPFLRLKKFGISSYS